MLTMIILWGQLLWDRLTDLAGRRLSTGPAAGSDR